jgi:hypothetical protein
MVALKLLFKVGLLRAEAIKGHTLTVDRLICWLLYDHSLSLGADEVDQDKSSLED